MGIQVLIAALLIIALICFVLGACERPERVSPARLVAAGLFLWLLSTLIQLGVK